MELSMELYTIVDTMSKKGLLIFLVKICEKK